MNNADQQREHFARIRHDERFRWQTEDAFVQEHEHATIQPLAEVIREKAEQGNVRVLESGCGEGVNIIHLRQMGLAEDCVSIKGVDFSPEAIAEAQRHGLDVAVADGLALPFADASFDVTFCRDVFHHLANDEERKRFFAEMRRVTKPDGFVVAIEPNPQNPTIRCLSYAVKAERGLRQISERHFTSLLPGATVFRVTPSAAWRLWYHYRSPFSRLRFFAPLTRWKLRLWDRMSRWSPQRFWSYRVYVWKR